MFEEERRTIRYRYIRQYNTSIGIYETTFCQTADNHLTFCVSTFALIYEWYGTQFIKFYLCLSSSTLNSCICCCVTSDTTGVESTQSKLSTWLTNSLCSDDTNSLTLLYHTLGSKVTSVTLLTNTLTALTSEY